MNVKSDFVESFLEQAADSFPGAFSYKDLRKEAKRLIGLHLQKRLDRIVLSQDAATELKIPVRRIRGWIDRGTIWAEKREVWRQGRMREMWVVKLSEVRKVNGMSRSERYRLGVERKNE